ncbi:MAG: haloacid dehalogenase [Ignavibacteria bacterium RBG_13_36_8]|nr:MAG: haloacid dehalogenase [Ignavibacteria bacterium RBG_13_36_8]
MKEPKEILEELKPEKEFFIGIDSDGCVFDTMEIKHKECFCPNTIKHWNLQMISKYVREAWDYVNLYSNSRGTNRFKALLEVVDLLRDRREVIARKAVLPNLEVLADWVKKESKLGNPELEKYTAEVINPIIDQTLKWSKAINESIAEIVYGIPPFSFVVESLELLSKKADAIVVSQTPVEALIREWEENDIDKYVKLIAGQEYGTKAEHIKFAAKDKYEADKILMIGDAPGDLNAAKSNGVLFYPVNPGHEEDSWERFFNEALDKFFAGSYTGEYESELINAFEKYLPNTPPWK